MGWNDRMGFTTDEELEDYIAAVEDEGDRLRKVAKEDQLFACSEEDIDESGGVRDV